MIAELVSRLRERRGEIEQATLARVHSVSDPAKVKDPEYVLGLRDAVGNGIDYALTALEAGPRQQAPVPPQMVSQARAAARNGVSLDTVLRRYSAAYTLLGDYLIEEAERNGVVGEELKRALRTQAAVYDHLVSAISEEYAREAEGRRPGVGQRRAELVKMLLAGDPADPSDLRYELDAWHIGAIIAGEEAEEVSRDLATSLDRRLLFAAVDEDTGWAWFGGQRRVCAREALAETEVNRLAGTVIAIGEPAWGIPGWRFTHRQAQAAMPIARRKGMGLVCYGDVSLLASMLQDEVLTESLRENYLVPLSEQRDGGRVLRKTLRVYFAVERNVSSAAAALKVDRKTVNNRLRLVEERLGRSLHSCAAELEAALRLDEAGFLSAAFPATPPNR